jgi:hypothetical protein
MSNIQSDCALSWARRKPRRQLDHWNVGAGIAVSETATSRRRHHDLQRIELSFHVTW